MALSLTSGSYLAEIPIPAQVRNYYKDHGGRRALYPAAVASDVPGLAPPAASPAIRDHPCSRKVGYPPPSTRRFPNTPQPKGMASLEMGHRKTHLQPYKDVPYARGDDNVAAQPASRRRVRYDHVLARKPPVSGLKHVPPPRPRAVTHQSGLMRVSKSPFSDPFQLTSDGNTSRPSRLKTYPDVPKFERRGGRKGFGVPSSDQVHDLMIRPESAPAEFASRPVPVIKGFTTLGDAGKKHRSSGYGSCPFARDTPRTAAASRSRNVHHRRVQYDHVVHHKETPSSMKHVPQPSHAEVHSGGRARAGDWYYSDPFQLQGDRGINHHGRKHFNSQPESMPACLAHTKLESTAPVVFG